METKEGRLSRSPLTRPRRAWPDSSLDQLHPPVLLAAFGGAVGRRRLALRRNPLAMRRLPSIWYAGDQILPYRRRPLFTQAWFAVGAADVVCVTLDR